MAMLYVGDTPSALQPVPLDPSTLEWGLQDISSSDAGRVHDGENTMYKMRTSQKRKLNLAWKEPTADVASWILRAFNAEYFYVRYFDPMDNQTEVRCFYAGDRSAPVRWHNVNDEIRFSTLSFNIIER